MKRRPVVRCSQHRHPHCIGFTFPALETSSQLILATLLFVLWRFLLLPSSPRLVHRRIRCFRFAPLTNRFQAEKLMHGTRINRILAPEDSIRTNDLTNTRHRKRCVTHSVFPVYFSVSFLVFDESQRGTPASSVIMGRSSNTFVRLGLHKLLDTLSTGHTQCIVSRVEFPRSTSSRPSLHLRLIRTST